MKNNFYVAIVHHKKKLFKSQDVQKLVLYSEDNFNFLDLLSGIWYTIDSNEKDYVERDTIIPTDISLYREDYLYLLSRYRENSFSRRKKFKIH